MITIPAIPPTKNPKQIIVNIIVLGVFFSLEPNWKLPPNPNKNTNISIILTINFIVSVIITHFLSILYHNGVIIYLRIWINVIVVCIHYGSKEPNN